jgi:hypothetical protein
MAKIIAVNSDPTITSPSFLGVRKEQEGAAGPLANVRSAYVPWKGGAFQWVQVPPGNAPPGSNRSGYEGSEIAEAFD